MKVGFLSASLSRCAGGVYDASRNLALGLTATGGCEVEVFGLEDEWTQEDVQGWGALTTNALPTSGPGLLGYAPGLRAALARARLDILHSHGLWMYPSRASLQWARVSGRPHVISPHGMLDPWALDNSRWKKRLAGFLYEVAHLRSAACIHALCKAEADAIRSFGLTNPVCVIPNGVELTANASASEAPGWARELPTGAGILLYLGRIHPKKGLRELIKGWRQARLRSGVQERWHLVIAGWDQGGHEEELKALVQTLHLEGSIHFVGPQFGRDKHLTYRSADAFVLPSLSEGLPMVVLEAWAYGLPVLLTPQCNLPEGFVAKAAIEIAADADSIAKGLEVLFDLSPQRRAELGAGGQRLIREKFNWPTIARQILSVYRWVLGEVARPECVLTV